MVRGTRQDTHKRIAKKALKLRPEIAENGPETLAHHYSEAGLLEEAVDWWTRAGQAASAASANLEAVTVLARGLDLVGELPVSEACDRRELAMQTALFGPLISVKGQYSEELEAAYSRIIRRSTEEIQDRIDHGDHKLMRDGELRRVPLTGKDLSVVGGIAFDKRQLMRRQPTAIRSDTYLQDLADEFEAISRQQRARVVSTQIAENASAEDDDTDVSR